MVCPICIVDGVAIAACRLFGVPDIITVFFLGVLITPLAITTSNWLNRAKWWTHVKYQTLLITIMYVCITLLTLDYMGMLPL